MKKAAATSEQLRELCDLDQCEEDVQLLQAFAAAPAPATADAEEEEQAAEGLEAQVGALPGRAAGLLHACARPQLIKHVGALPAAVLAH